MDDDKYMSWFDDKFDENAQLFAEKVPDAFEDFCLARYINYFNGEADYNDRKEDC